MTNDIALITKSPLECSDTDLNLFVALVESEGEVQGGLIERVKARGEVLVFLYQSDFLAGIAAIKRPYNGYKSKVFKNTKTSLQPDNFSLELGWIVVSKDFRNKGFAKMLIKNAMMLIGDKNVIATTRQNNTVIQRLLESEKFVLCGEPYPSEFRNECVVLFARH